MLTATAAVFFRKALKASVSTNHTGITFSASRPHSRSITTSLNISGWTTPPSILDTRIGTVERNNSSRPKDGGGWSYMDVTSIQNGCPKSMKAGMSLRSICTNMK
ncbi:MAG: hypothetical protein IKS33_02680 [Bacteroidales bacterium]|nr:hypothetical protein [Bacteroidales bacterium]